jgi:esterase FrsA
VSYYSYNIKQMKHTLTLVIFISLFVNSPSYGFTFDLNPSELFKERAKQFEMWGIPKKTIASVRERIHDSWSSGPGGWVYEWTQEAELAEQRGDHLLAASLFGAARFPVLATPERKKAYQKQIELFLQASKDFQFPFERIKLNLTYHAQPIEVPIHIYQNKNPKAPLLIVFGGVDTWKVELHPMALKLVRRGHFTVITVDMPGTGESTLPLAEDSEQVFISLIQSLKVRYGSDSKVGVIGISFGGHWAAKLALTGMVDAAVDLGGPVGEVPLDGTFLSRLPAGMTGIVAHALHLKRMPTPKEAETLLKKFSLRQQGLFEKKETRPLLAINGEQDPYIPNEETKVFEQFDHAKALLIPNSTHCAAEKLPHVAPYMVAWLRYQLLGPTFMNRLLLWLTWQWL